MHSFEKPIKTDRVECLRTLIAIVAIVVAGGGPVTIAADDAIPTRAATACTAESPGLPDTIQIPVDLRTDVERMLKRSRSFRRQCRRLSDATWLHILVRLNVGLVNRPYRARSVIRRARSGTILVIAEISPHGSPVEWIAHEFEHALEQLEGVPLPELAARSREVWQSAEGMFETERAIRAGRAVVEEMRGKFARPDKLVE